MSEAVTATTAPPGTDEDIQRLMGSYVGHDQIDIGDATAAVEAAREAGTIDAAQQRQFRRGLECAAARASERLTLYDGQLTPETLAMVHDEATREPYSPSRLETFAACGFKYYMERVLGIEEPDELTIEPDALAKGSYVHDVLEHYYRELQDAQGTPISLFEADPYLTAGVGVEPVADKHREAVLLDVALDRLDEAFDAPATAYHEEWLTKVLAGLGEPTENPYYEYGAYDAPERGLFGRFVDDEAEDVGLASARPAWFEPHVGEPRADELVLQDDPVDVSTPSEAVPVTGQIDRIDMVPGSDPRQLVVRDYKTGSTPSESETLSGLKFQLPLYAILAEATLDDVEVVGGSYYKLKPSPTLNHRGGQIGSKEHTGHVRYGKTEKPMGTKQSYPQFEGHDEFQAFITDVVPSRLGIIAQNVEHGRFHPTVLDPTDAGCSYCPYADVCDVRSHRRHAVIDWMDENSVDAYVPPIATDADLDSALEVR